MDLKEETMQTASDLEWSSTHKGQWLKKETTKEIWRAESEGHTHNDHKVGLLADHFALIP